MARIPRIAWVAPVDAETGLARYSLLALRALADSADVTVWHPPARGETVELAGVKCVEFDDPVRAADEIGEVDGVVYNVCNSVRYGGGVFDLYRRRPGIVILHDKYMHDFFYDYFVVREREPERFVALMAYLYGEDGANAAIDELQIRRRPEPDRFPLAGEVLFNAYGVLVHSNEGARLASRYGTLVPVQRVNMPLRDVPRPGPAGRGIRDKRLKIASTGRLDPRKQPERLIEAYANSALLREKATLVFAGYADPAYVGELLRMARARGVDHLVEIKGAVTEAEFVKLLSSADICVNLRWPATELVSASLMEQFAFGRTVVACDVGFYSEPPDDTIVRISAQGNAAELRVALEKLVRNELQRRALGERAQAWALEACSDEQYRAGFFELLSHVHMARPAIDSIDAQGASAVRTAKPGDQVTALHELASRLTMGESSRARPAQDGESEAGGARTDRSDRAKD